MPTYDYRCKDCATELEVVQKFTDDALTVCPECEGTLRKVYSAVGVVFKGSGFYRTDSRAQDKQRSSSDASGGADSKKSADKSESKTDASGGGSNGSSGSGKGGSSDSGGSGKGGSGANTSGNTSAKSEKAASSSGASTSSS